MSATNVSTSTPATAGPDTTTARRIVHAAGVSVERIGRKVVITASDDYEAGLLEDSLNDKTLFALLLVTGALRKLPNSHCRFTALSLVRALTAAGQPGGQGQD